MHGAIKPVGQRFPTKIHSRCAYLEAKEGHDKVDEGQRDAGKAERVRPLVCEDDEDGAAVVHQHVQLRRPVALHGERLRVAVMEGGRGRWKA